MKTKIIIFTVFTLLLFYLSLFVSGFIPFIADNKTDLRANDIAAYTFDVLLHPIETIQTLHGEQNPLLYLTLAGSLILIIISIVKTRTKEYENVSDKYGVQGSARWANKTEIFKVPEQITVIPSNSMVEELKKSMKKEVG